MSSKGLILGGILGGGAGLVLGLILGVALMAGFGYLQSGGTNIPYDQMHNDLASRYSVYSVTWNKPFVLHHLQTSIFTLKHSTFPFAVFTEGHGYTQSDWTWTENGDVEVYMTITGPTDDNTTIVEFSRVCYNSVHIEGPNMDVTWPQGGEQGYTFAQVSVGK
jgi:hypothetical protein